MKKNSGVSLISLIVTIIVMIILIGIVGLYSMDTIKKGHEAVNKRELENVRDYTIRQKIRMDDDKFDVNLTKYPKIKLTSEMIYTLTDGKLTNQETSDIVSVNSSDLEDKYKYHYLQASEKYFEDSDFSNDDISVKDVKKDYIINFYIPTVICISDDAFAIDGIIKGVDEIKLEIKK